MLKKKMEEKGKLAKEIRRLSDVINEESRDFTTEEQENWDKVNADYNAVLKQIDAIQRADEVDKDIEQRQELDEELRGNGIETQSNTKELAFNAWCRGVDHSTDEMRSAAEACGFKLSNISSKLELTIGQRAPKTLDEARALSAVQGSTGAFTVAPVFASSLEKALLAYGGMRQVSEVLRTETGAELQWPTFDDTSNEGEIIGENATHETATDLDFEQKKWNAYQFSSKVLKVPVQLLEDSAFDMNQIVADACGERVSRYQNRKYTVGTGANQPYGITEVAPTGVTTASATAITGDEIIDLAHSVDPAYRSMPGVGYMMHDSILKTVRKLKDGNDQYLWQPGLQLAIPDILYGKRVQVNQNMASSVVASAKTMAFGDLSKYKIRDVRTIVVRRLVERYAEFNQVGFLVIMRSDGNLLDAGTNPVKLMVQKSS